MQRYRNEVLAYLSVMPPVVKGQQMRSIIRNFAEFFERGALDWKFHSWNMSSEDISKMVRKACGADDRSPAGLLAEDRWWPRSWVACVVSQSPSSHRRRLVVIEARIAAVVSRVDAPSSRGRHEAAYVLLRHPDLREAIHGPSRIRRCRYASTPVLAVRLRARRALAAT